MNTSGSLLLWILAGDVGASLDNLCVNTGVHGSLVYGPVLVSLSSWACGFKTILPKSGSDWCSGAGLNRTDWNVLLDFRDAGGRVQKMLAILQTGDILLPEGPGILVSCKCSPLPMCDFSLRR